MLAKSLRVLLLSAFTTLLLLGPAKNAALLSGPVGSPATIQAGCDDTGCHY